MIKTKFGELSTRFRNYLKKIIHLDDHPESISRGFAIGIFIGMTPYMGFHTISGIITAAIFRSNKIAAVLGVMITNPVSAPFVYAANYFIGEQFFPGPARPLTINWSAASLISIIKDVPQFFLILTVGGIILGVPLAVLSYFLIKKLIIFYRNQHAVKITNQPGI